MRFRKRRERVQGSRCKIRRLAVALCLSAGIGGCGPVTVREYNAARWIKPDTTLAFIFHHFAVGGADGVGLPEYNDYSSSNIRLYQIGLDADGFHSQILLFHSDNAVPCGELAYRPGDSLLFFSYLETDGRNGRLRHDCGAANGAKRLAVGKLADSAWTPLADTSLDTGFFLAELTNARTVPEPGLAIDSAHARLCAGGWCINSSNP